MLNSKKLDFLIVIFLLFTPVFAQSSAWLVAKNKIKIISQLEFKKFYEVNKSGNDIFMKGAANHFKINAAYGISDWQNLVGELNFNKLYNYTIINVDKKHPYIISKKSNKLFHIPNQFESFSLGLNLKLLNKAKFISSNEIKLTILPDEEFQFNYKVACGNNFAIKKKDFFIQAEFYLNFNPIFYNYDNKLSFSLGYKKSPKKTYILYLESYLRKNYYNKFFDQKVNLSKKFSETRVQLTTVTHINKKVSFQKSLFTTITREKNFASSGINLGFWIDL